MTIRYLVLPVVLIMAGRLSAQTESFPPLTGSPPQNFDELWDGYDPAKEPLDVKIVHTWEAQGITTRMLVYNVGVFKGRVSRMGAYYAFPTETSGRIPAILQMHGGGQRASREMAEAAAANGYACISINWGGKPMADQKPRDAGTDWGAVDATQTSHNGHYSKLTPDDRTLDSVVSPRNNNWFLIVVAARRALTFLQQQPEVDPDRLGVRGHSMGGKLTVMTAGTDSRVKAAFPSCGGTAPAPQRLRNRLGSSCRPENKEPLYHTTISDLVAIRRITCPILYAGPHNDFNGNLDNLYANWREMPGRDIHFTISPHLNHRHVSEAQFAGPHFFDVILKGAGVFPRTPQLQVNLKTSDGVPVANLMPDRPDEVVKVTFYYSVDPHALTRFWRMAPATRDSDRWTAKCPIISTDMPLFVMANVYYPLKKQITGPRWARVSPETFVVSSWGLDFDPSQLQAAGVKVVDATDRTIVAEFDSWQDWYQLERRNPGHRQAVTRKIKDPKWRGPDGAKLAIDVLDAEGGEFAVTFGLNGWSAYAGMKQGDYFAAKPLVKSEKWQTLEFDVSDLVPLDERPPKGLRSWQYMTTLGIVAKVRRRQDGQQVEIAGTGWPEHRQFRNLRWIGGKYPASFVMPGQSISPEEYRRTFQSEIDKSVEQEKRDAKTQDGNK